MAFAATAASPARGLVVHFKAGDGASDARPARTIALYVPEGQSPTPFLAPGAFKATWQGKLVLEKRSRLIFTLEGTGKARLLVDDKVLVEEIGSSDQSKRLSSGEHKIVCEYQSPPDGDAQLRLFWEEREFLREPVPARAFVHDPDDAALAAYLELHRGRALVAEKRCVACHRSAGNVAMLELELAPPSLDGVGARLRQDWLARWIANPKSLRPSAHMPVVFEANAVQDAADIAAYLAAGTPDDEAAPLATAEQVKQGGHLFHQQGCIACHTFTPRGDAQRIGLAQVGHKFRPGALAEFLREPAKFHRASRMPTFQFSAQEAADLEGFLRSLANDPGSAFPAGDAKRGNELFASSGCLDCHDRGEEKSTLPAAPPLADLETADCSAPGYELTARDRAALAAFLTDKPAHASLGRSVPAEFAQRQLEVLRCDACHSRDGSQPTREKFAAEVVHLEPPAAAAGKPALKVAAPPLDHLGVKLRPEWRHELFAGQIEAKLRPWLPARMPAFPSRADTLAIGFSHAAGLRGIPPELPAVDPAKVKVGAAMTGTGGLACATCHAIGDRPAIAVFEGEGPNLSRAARLNRDYFRRWMGDPPRLWPGTIMPKYALDGKTPLTQHYDGDAAKQFDAIYDYLRSLSEK